MYELNYETKPPSICRREGTVLRVVARLPETQPGQATRQRDEVAEALVQAANQGDWLGSNL